MERKLKSEKMARAFLLYDWMHVTLKWMDEDALATF